MIFKLFKIFSSNLFSFRGLKDEKQKGPKSVIKNIFFILLFLYLIGSFVVYYGFFMLNTYKQLKLTNETFLMPSATMLIALITTLFFGFTSVTSNYYTGNGEEQFLAMPITSTQLFGAKFCTSLVVDAVLGLAMFAISSCIYGYNEGLLSHPLFWIGMLISGITLSIISLAIIYTLLIVVLTLIPAFRKRNILTGLASFFIIVMAIVYSLFMSRASISMTVSEETLNMPNPIATTAGLLNDKSAFFRFVTNALQENIVSMLCLIAITAVIIFVLIPVLGKLYVNSLNGFGDVKSKKITKEQASQVLNKDLHSASLFKAFLWRDIKTVWREPTFFANGPLMVFLFPVIMLVSFVIGMLSAGSGNIGNIIAEVQEDIQKISPDQMEKVKYYITLVVSGFSMFIGSSCNIASSSFSREGKDMYVIKAMPVQPSIVAKVKFWHSISYVIIADLILSLFLVGIQLMIHFPISVSEFLVMIVMVLAMSCSVSLSIIFVEMFIDTAHPKLNWENPIAAFKQNMNSVISVFFSMAVIAICILLGIFVLPKNQTGELIFVVIFGIISAPIGAKYFKYAERKIPLM